MTVLDFLTGGIYNSLHELLIAITQWLITFITNTSANFYTPIINIVLGIVPTFDNFNNIMNIFFSYINLYLGYIKDFLFISQPVLTYLILSLIFKITAPIQVYIVKLVLKWYKALFP